MVVWGVLSCCAEVLSWLRPALPKKILKPTGGQLLHHPKQLGACSLGLGTDQPRKGEGPATRDRSGDGRCSSSPPSRPAQPNLVRCLWPNRNHPSALLYLWAACGGRAEPVPFDRLSPQVLEVVLNMANLEHADLPLNQGGCTTLMALMRFHQESDYDAMAEDSEDPEYPLPHDCRCEPELLNFENDHLSKMVSLLLARGAKWNTPPLSGGLSALGELRALLSDEEPALGLSKYKQHNVTEFRKHIVLDIYSESAASAPDFNPFEMGAIKATQGGC